MARVNRYVFILFSLSTALILWTHCDTKSPVPPLPESEQVEYQELTYDQRIKKLEECKSCHPDVFHNEMIGPHSQSYTKLLEHQAMADTSSLFPRPYHQFVVDNFEDACASCHAPKNLFESNYAGLEGLKDFANFTAEAYPEAWRLPPSRSEGDNRLTGIDCLSCHQKGDRMITTEDFKRNPDLDAPCNPMASKFFSANESCITCHAVTNTGMADNVNNQALTSTMSCNGCHMEKDQNGKYSHYYYWRHEDKEKEQYPLLTEVFDDVEINRMENGSTFEFHWDNKRAPHRFSECAELYVNVVFYDNQGKECDQFIKRLNNKLSHDKALVSYFGEEQIWGEVGCTFLPSESNCSDTITLDCSNLARIEVSGYEKPQYWISDQLAHKVYSKTIKL